MNLFVLDRDPRLAARAHCDKHVVKMVLETAQLLALAGLPAFVRAAAQQAAADRGLQGHVITLSRSLVVPFLTYSQRADLREQAWRAWTSRGEHAGEHDNRELARDILRVQHGHEPEPPPAPPGPPAVPPPAALGRRSSPSIRRRTPNKAPNSNTSSTTRFPKAGKRAFPPSPPTRRAWPAAIRPARC